MDKILEQLRNLDVTKINGESLEISDEAEKELIKVLEAEKLVEEAKKILKDKFLIIAQQNPQLKKYEGDHVQVGYRAVRRKKVTGNVDDKFMVIKKEPNTKVIESYREATGELPQGIEEETFEYITFKLS